MSRREDTLITLRKFSLEEILPLVPTSTRKVKRRFQDQDGNEWKIKVSSLRLQVFHKSLQCSRCDRVGAYFLMQKAEKDLSPHFNLYAGDGTLMTKDHILPKSKGGKDRLDNLQTMCVECNEKKDDRYQLWFLHEESRDLVPNGYLSVFDGEEARKLAEELGPPELISFQEDREDIKEYLNWLRERFEEPPTWDCRGCSKDVIHQLTEWRQAVNLAKLEQRKKHLQERLNNVQALAKKLGVVLDFDCYGAPAVYLADNPEEVFYLRTKQEQGMFLIPKGTLPFSEEVFLSTVKY